MHFMKSIATSETWHRITISKAFHDKTATSEVCNRKWQHRIRNTKWHHRSKKYKMASSKYGIHHGTIGSMEYKIAQSEERHTKGHHWKYGYLE